VLTQHQPQHAVTSAFIAAAAEQGLPRWQQPTETGQQGAGYLACNIDSNGKRISAARAWLQPAKSRANLTVLTGAQVQHVVIENGRACGVKASIKGRLQQFQTGREVVLCAGALESPQLLQRSGIGDSQRLAKLGIQTVHHNANVGANLREHFVLGMNFEVKHWQDSENRQYQGWRLLKNVAQYAFFGRGFMAQPPCHAAAAINTGLSAAGPDIQLMFSPFSRQGNGFSPVPGISFSGYALYPQSRGEVHITAAELAAPPVIKPNYLSAVHDQQLAVAVVRYARRLAASKPLQRHIQQESLQSQAAQTEQEIVAYYRQYGTPGFHAAGSCAMGANAQTSVVDASASVHGVDGLRVIDNSICPQILAGFTNATVMAVALRASELLLAHYP
jgi:choline dehydrogenase-like flavoprotein